MSRPSGLACFFRALSKLLCYTRRRHFAPNPVRLFFAANRLRAKRRSLFLHTRYDAYGIRISAVVEVDTNADGSYDTRTETEFLNDPHNQTGYSQVLVETTIDPATSQIQKRVVYTLGHERISQTATTYSGGSPQSTETLSFGQDGHGSTRVLLDAAGAIATVAGARQLFHYDAYGNPLGFDPAAAATDFLYSGEQTDSTGLQYLRARYYNPATGRFNRLDPFAGDTQDPQSLHKYLYAHGDPVNGVDPTGEFFSLVGIIAGIGMACLEYAMPGPFDYVKSGVQALVDAYSVNLSWDVAWAQNWDLSDHLHSRNDDLWVYAALGGGLYDAFNVDIPFWGTVNLLDPFDGNTTQSLSRGRVGSVGSAIRRFAGNQVARYSMRHAVEWATQVGKRMVNTVDYYTHPLIKDRLGRVLYIVDLDRKSVV